MDLGLSPGLPLSIALCDGTIRLLRTRLTAKKEEIAKLLSENQTTIADYDAHLRVLERKTLCYREDPDLVASLRMLKLAQEKESQASHGSELWSQVRRIALRRDYERVRMDDTVISRKAADLSALLLQSSSSSGAIEFYLWLVGRAFCEQLAGLPHLAALFKNDCRWLVVKHSASITLGEEHWEALLRGVEAELSTLTPAQARSRLTQLERGWREILPTAELTTTMTRLSEGVCKRLYLTGGDKLDFDWTTLPACPHQRKLSLVQELHSMSPLQLINAYRHGFTEGILETAELAQLLMRLMPTGPLRTAFLQEIDE